LLDVVTCPANPPPEYRDIFTVPKSRAMMAPSTKRMEQSLFSDLRGKVDDRRQGGKEDGGMNILKVE
jgi:hypothetical protein